MLSDGVFDGSSASETAGEPAGAQITRSSTRRTSILRVYILTLQNSLQRIAETFKNLQIIGPRTCTDE